ncbi:hypothetical protein OSB04_031826 [Centaurea solstitialis]|uniref:LRAT domain-containing protein n=1 Tax=Centaurea solstitialis TaxID=347529 RepID=A0AA38SVE5_9ASTR|nr:hypothetical protein OSB04_031826 [Centaurea solstitialis]
MCKVGRHYHREEEEDTHSPQALEVCVFYSPHHVLAGKLAGPLGAAAGERPDEYFGDWWERKDLLEEEEEEEEEIDMGFLSNRVEKSEIKAGDHIYTYRAVFAYSHHGIYVGGNKVVHFTHFTPDRESSSSTETSSDSHDEMSKMPSSCQAYPDCGFRQPKSGVVLSCLDCFLRNGALYSFEYGVTPTFFLAKVRGGTCTTATSDGPGTVIHRAMYLLQNGFGNYDVFQNNCEDFALYCKTGILTVDKLGIGEADKLLLSLVHRWRLFSPPLLSC